MSSGADYFLKKTLGEDFFESLSKVELWKPGTKSTLDHEEIRTALQIVPRTVISLLIRELSPMNIGETKEIVLEVGSSSALDAKMRVTKHERDVYSGEIEQDNKKIAEFKFRSIPGVGLVIMTAFELYDMENLINSSNTPRPNPAIPPQMPIPLASQVTEEMGLKVQKLIDERMALHDLVSKVVDKRMTEKDAIKDIMMMRLTEELHKQKEQISNLAAISKQSAHSDEYLRGMANGVEVINATVHNKEPKFIDPPKKKRPLTEFLEKRKKKEYEVHLSKGETVSCPDCGKNIFDGQLFSGCICLGQDMERKIFIKKSEDGIKVRFSKGWDQENIEMLLEVLRRKHG